MARSLVGIDFHGAFFYIRYNFRSDKVKALLIGTAQI
jgi:hypothetical protein